MVPAVCLPRLKGWNARRWRRGTTECFQLLRRAGRSTLRLAISSGTNFRPASQMAPVECALDCQPCARGHGIDRLRRLPHAEGSGPLRGARRRARSRLNVARPRFSRTCDSDASPQAGLVHRPSTYAARPRPDWNHRASAGVHRRQQGDGERAGTRTPNLVIKSHLLYQLSYAPVFSAIASRRASPLGPMCNRLPLQNTIATGPDPPICSPRPLVVWLTDCRCQERAGRSQSRLRSSCTTRR